MHVIFMDLIASIINSILILKYSDPSEELEEWMNEPTKFSYDNSTYIIYPVDKTWDESRLYCYDRGSMLAHIHSIELAKLMVAAMGDHPKGE